MDGLEISRLAEEFEHQKQKSINNDAASFMIRHYNDLVLHIKSEVKERGLPITITNFDHFTELEIEVQLSLVDEFKRRLQPLDFGLSHMTMYKNRKGPGIPITALVVRNANV